MESSSTTGTSTFTVTGARIPGRALSSVVANGDTFHYSIRHKTLGEWEVGLGTMVTSTTFSRSVIASSNSNNLVNFSAGLKDVDLVYPASRIAALYGDGLQAGTSGALNIDVSDFAGTGLEDDGSENLRIASAAAGAGLTGGAGSALAVGAGTHITVNADDVAVNTTTLLAAIDSTSIVVNAGTLETAAVTGAIAIAQNGTASTFGASSAGAGLTGGGTGTLAVGAGTGITVNADDVQLTTIADDTFMANVSGGAAVATGKTFSSLAGDGLTYDATNHELDVVGSTSIIVTSDTVTRAALTGVVTASANSNTTAFDATAAATTSFAGVSELATSAETLTGTDTVRSVTPDALAALWEAGTDNTGGATITLGDGGSFNLITSTTAITAFAFTTDKAGRCATIQFSTVRTLTHNATSLILPTAANITTAVGDVCQVQSLGSGNFRVNYYTRANGTPLGLTYASTTEVLTGTSGGAGVVTPINLAALWRQGTNNTGGATITLGDGAYFNLNTSTTAITAIEFSTLTLGRTATLYFNTVRTLTHSSTLVLPTGANITTAVGDTCQVTLTTSLVYRINYYTRADGTALTGSLPTIAADSFLLNATGSSAQPAATAGSTVAGAGLTYTTGGILAVGAGTGITVNANDVAITDASTTQVLTGTSASVVATPNAIAALWEAGAQNADGATITLGEGGTFDLITSTTTITSIVFATDRAGRTAVLSFSTVRTLTHSATLQLPTSANITTAIGDLCEVCSLGSGNARVNWYQRKNGQALVDNPVSGAVSGTAGVTKFAGIQNATAATTDRTNLNFSGFTIADNSGNDSIDITNTNVPLTEQTYGAGGTLNNLVVTADTVRFTTANAIWTGLSAITTRPLYVTNSGVIITVTHNSGSSAIPILCPGSVDFITPMRGGFVLIPDVSGSFMRIVDSGNPLVRKNSTGTVFSRPQINLIEGAGVTLTVADDSTNNEVDVTIASSTGVASTLTSRTTTNPIPVIGSAVVIASLTIPANTTSAGTTYKFAAQANFARVSGTTANQPNLSFRVGGTALLSANTTSDALSTTAGASYMARIEGEFTILANPGSGIAVAVTGTSYKAITASGPATSTRSDVASISTSATTNASLTIDLVAYSSATGSNCSVTPLSGYIHRIS